MAQSDARPTGNQVAGSTPARSATFFRGESEFLLVMRLITFIH